MNYNINIKFIGSELLARNEVKKMEKMNRMTISVTPEIERAVVELRKTNEFCRSSYSEIIRQLIIKGLDSDNKHGIGSKK